MRPLAEPLQPVGGLVALFGSLAPKGAIFKRSAADPNLFEKEGRAVVFTSLEDLSARIDDPDLDVTPDDFLVLQNAGPLSPSGMPEAGYLPIPAKLARAGVKDMVRISDARMSGTAYGSIVLHVTPDAASGGPLAKVRNGDRIRLSVKERRIDLLVAARRAGAPQDRAGRRCPSAATPASTAARSCRPTAAAISISCASTRSGTAGRSKSADADRRQFDAERDIAGEALSATSDSDERRPHEMANLYPDTTGLPMTVWVSPRGNARHDIRVKVNMTHGDRMDITNTAVVAVRPRAAPIVSPASCRRPTMRRRSFEWISLNADGAASPIGTDRSIAARLIYRLRPISQAMPPRYSCVFVVNQCPPQNPCPALSSSRSATALRRPMPG